MHLEVPESGLQFKHQQVQTYPKYIFQIVIQISYSTIINMINDDWDAYLFDFGDNVLLMRTKQIPVMQKNNLALVSLIHFFDHKSTSWKCTNMAW